MHVNAYLFCYLRIEVGAWTVFRALALRASCQIGSMYMYVCSAIVQNPKNKTSEIANSAKKLARMYAFLGQHRVSGTLEPPLHLIWPIGSCWDKPKNIYCATVPQYSSSQYCRQELCSSKVAAIIDEGGCLEF